MEKMGTTSFGEKMECKDGWFTVRASRVQGMGLHFSVTQEFDDNDPAIYEIEDA